MGISTDLGVNGSPWVQKQKLEAVSLPLVSLEPGEPTGYGVILRPHPLAVNPGKVQCTHGLKI